MAKVIEEIGESLGYIKGKIEYIKEAFKEMDTSIKKSNQLLIRIERYNRMKTKVLFAAMVILSGIIVLLLTLK